MFEKIEIKDLELDIEDPQLGMVVDSIREENTDGVLWRDGRTYLLWDKGNVVFYLFGEAPDKEGLKVTKEFFMEEILPAAREENFSHFKARDLTGLQKHLFEFIFSEFGTTELQKYFYEHVGEKVQIEKEGVTFLPIDNELLSDASYENLTEVLTEVKWMWPSFDRFFEKGFGTAALKEKTIVCWCTAEYVSEGKCGVGIETAEEHREEGIASRTAARFVGRCKEKNITPYWECMADNVPSVKIAEKLGFDKVSEPLFILGKF